jgi:MerR family redox-sensitive transcriptional activator SoxR
VLDRLRLIRAGQQAGFTLKEVATLLSEATSGARLSTRWRELAQRKLAELDGLAARVTAMRELLREGLRCGCLGPEDCALVARAMAEQPVRIRL